MLEKLRDYLTKLYKTAYHSILKSFRQFLPLLIAVFLIESLLFTIFLAFQNNVSLRNAKIAKEYKHHLTISGLNEGEMLLLRNDDRTVSSNDMCFDVIKTMQYESAAYDATYTVYVKILTGNKNYGIFGRFIDDSLETNYLTMRSRYADVFGTDGSPNTRLSVEFTPLYTQDADVNREKCLCITSLFLVGFVSAVIFYSLYCVYLNDKKFSFGIYATFGASKHELRTQAMAELLIACGVAILPSYYLSSLLCMFLYRYAGSPFSAPLISLKAWLFIFLCVGATLYLSVLFAMKRVVQAEPAKLISSEEKANPISLPKRSLQLLNGKFPLLYESLSALRLRRHHLMLSFFSAFLSVLFLLGFYLSAIYADDLSERERTSPHFKMYFSNVSMLNEEYVSIFQGLDNLTSVYTLPISSSAEEYAAFLRIPDANIIAKNGLVEDKENALHYTGDFRIYSGAFDIADYFSSLYEVSGDPDALLHDTQSVLIGKTVQNADAFRFSVGDTVTVAVAETDENGEIVYLAEDAEKISNLTGRSFWKAAYESFSFRYYTFTVVGIIENYPSAVDGTPIVMHPDAYEKITGTSPAVNEMTFRVSQDAETKEFLATESALRGIAARLGNCSVTTEQSFFEGQVEAMYGYTALVRAVTVLLLFFLPLTWLYSQALFFKKREKEFYILNAISAPLSKIRSLYLCNLMLLIPIAVLSLLLTFSAFGIVFFLFERYLPSVFHISGIVTRATALPCYVYFVGILLTLPSCILSLLFPYFAYKKKYYGEKNTNTFREDN